jgi:5-methylthioribose kinase
MQTIYTEYCRVFFECWNKDAKPIYQDVPGLQEYVQKQLLQDMIGFCANSHIFRCAADIGYPEYDDLKDRKAIRNAKLLSLMMDHHMILHREEYPDAQAWIDDLLMILKEFIVKL